MCRLKIHHDPLWPSHFHDFHILNYLLGNAKLDIIHCTMAWPLAEKPGNMELGAAPLVPYYSVFSARPSLGYGTLMHCC